MIFIGLEACIRRGADWGVEDIAGDKLRPALSAEILNDIPPLLVAPCPVECPTALTRGLIVFVGRSVLSVEHAQNSDRIALIGRLKSAPSKPSLREKEAGLHAASSRIVARNGKGWSEGIGGVCSAAISLRRQTNGSSFSREKLIKRSRKDKPV